jgi:hypothetical protein
MVVEDSLESFEGALAAGFGADEAILGADVVLDGGDGIGGGEEVAGDMGGEHGEVIEVVSCGGGVLWGDLELSLDFLQGCAFAVAGVAEAGVDVIADDGEAGDGVAVSLEVIDDVIGLVIIGGDEAEGGVSIFVEGGVIAGLDPIDELGEVLLDLLEEGLVGLVAGLVPVGIGQVLGLLVAIDFAFDEDEVIGADGQVAASEAFHEGGHIASGIDDPGDTVGLELSDESLELGGDGWVFEFGEERAVEVGGEQLDGGCIHSVLGGGVLQPDLTGGRET